MLTRTHARTGTRTASPHRSDPLPLGGDKGEGCSPSRYARLRLPSALLTSLVAAVVLCLLAPIAAQAQPVCWTQWSVSGPSPRQSHAMAYDAARGVTVLFGGRSPSNPISDGETWEWDGTNWTQRTPAISPSPRAGHAMAYDSVRQVTVLFGGITPSGGFLGDTWEWDGSAWSLRSTGGPEARYATAMAFDSARGVTVLFGGQAPFTCCSLQHRNDTWEWDGSAWTPRGSGGPSPRIAPAMAYDSARGVAVLFGGAAGDSINPVQFQETWEWNGTSWAFRSTSGGSTPPARAGCAMAYDQARAVVVMSGGYGNVAVDNNTWLWNGTMWDMPDIADPPARNNHAMVFDEARGAVVLFGGSTGGGCNCVTHYGDTWSAAPPPVVYVDRAATEGNNSGTSWPNAFPELRDALAFASAQSCVHEIWVARGTYTPAPPGGSRAASFNLRNNLAIYGGFVGTETSLDQRPPLPTNATDALDQTKATILSGDLNGDDTGNLSRDDNAFHVLHGSGVAASALLDGVTAAGGYANGSPLGDTGQGGGAYLANASPTLTNIAFVDNAAVHGGGIACVNGAPTITGGLFVGNRATYLEQPLTELPRGGAIHAVNSSPIIRSVFFEKNSAEYWGGACSFEGGGEPALVLCSLVRNSVLKPDFRTGGGAVMTQGAATELTVVNSVFAGNKADFAPALDTFRAAKTRMAGCLIVGNAGNPAAASTVGGTIRSWTDAGAPSQVDLANCTVAHNSSTIGGFGGTGGLLVAASGATVANSIIWGNTAPGSDQVQDAQVRVSAAGGSGVALAYSTVEGWTGSFGGTANNGLFTPGFLTTPTPGGDGIWGTTDDNYGDLRLALGSPATESGDRSIYTVANGLNDEYDLDGDLITTEALPFDLAGLDRFFDHPSVLPHDKDNPPIDRGCYENQFCPTCPDPRQWTGAVDSNFANHGNWRLSAPGTPHDAVFDLNATYDVILPASTITTNLSATVVRGSVSLRLPTSSTYNLTATGKTALTVGNAPGEAPSLTLSGLGGGAGGQFRPTSGAIATLAGTAGTLTVTGSNTKLGFTTAQGLTVGQAGAGVLNILGGARVATQLMLLGPQAGGSGHVLIDGPGSTLTGYISLVVATGAIELRNGGSLSSPSGVVSLLQQGSLLGAGTISGDLKNFGTITPGTAGQTAPGTISINKGDYSQLRADPDFGNASGQLLMDVLGPSPGQHDQLAIQSGMAELGGGLVVQAPGDALAVPAAVGGPGSYNIPLLTAAEGINLDSKFDVVFLPRAQTPSTGDAPQFFRLDYTYAPAAQGGGVVRMSNQLLSTALDVHDPEGTATVGTPTAAATADLDNDGLDDLILTFNGSTPTSDGDVVIMLSRGANGSGEWLGFSPAQTLTTGVNPTDIAVFDIDGDGKVDIAVSNAGASGGQSSVSLFKNNTAPQLAPGNTPVFEAQTPVTLGMGLGTSGLAIDRFAKGPGAAAGSGLLSAALRPIMVTANPGAGEGSSSLITTFEAQPGTFNFIGVPPIVLIPSGKIPIRLRPVDIDGDSRADIAVLAQSGSAVLVYPNDSTGTGDADPAFGDPTVIATDPNPIDIGVVVLNDRPGLATLNHVPSAIGGSMSVIVNRTPAYEGGVFTRPFDIAPAVNLDAGLAPKSLAALDLDSDADDDLAVLTKVNATQTRVRIFRNDYNVGTENVNQQPTLVNATDVPESSTDALFVLRAQLVPGPNPDLITIVAAAGTGGLSAGLTADGSGHEAEAGGAGVGGGAAALTPVQNIRRLKNDTPPPAPAPGCVLDYNVDGVLNPDDLGDFITDYYTFPHVAGPGGYAIPCPGNEAPYTAGYKAAFTADGAGQCNEPFPDNLGDYITAYYGAGAACGG